MLTLSQTLKSKTVWVCIGLAAMTAWQALVSDPAIHIPEGVEHAVTILATFTAAVFRIVNTQGSENPPSPPPPSS